MRVLALTRYGRMGASSRLRTLQYIDRLQANGFEVEVSPLFSDGYLGALYHGQSRLGPALSGFYRRLSAILRARRHDVVWVEKELIPFFPALAEHLLARMQVPWIVDYDDALFHRYDQHGNTWVRRLLGRKIDAVMRLATAVVAGNEYLAARARVAGAKQVEIIPTVVDLQRYNPSAGDNRHHCTIGWIGSPSTAKYLADVAEPLARLQRRHDVGIRLVGAGNIELAGCDVEVVEWQESREPAQVASLDVGIMPLPDTPWERGKCGYKLIQYMACGLPVVASPVGVNGRIVTHDENGYLAATPEDWESALDRLVRDRELRQRMGTLGRRKVEQNYCLDVTAPRMHALLRSVVND